MVAIDVVRPLSLHLTWAYDLSCMLAGSLFVALCAQVAVPLPFSPVPLTGQTLAALLVGALLGSRRGTLSVLLYISEGLLGIPVFAGGALGLARLIGPTGGYLAGMVAGAFVVGLLAERGWDRKPVTMALAMVIGNAAIYLFGLAWLAHFVGSGQVLAAGLLPFVPGDLLKVALATGLLPAGWALFGRR